MHAGAGSCFKHFRGSADRKIAAFDTDFPSHSRAIAIAIAIAIASIQIVMVCLALWYQRAI